MQRIDASKLLALLLAQEKLPEFKIIISDNLIFKKIAAEKIRSDTTQLVNIFSGKNALIEFVDYAATGDLFCPPQKSIVELADKMTAKQWEGEKKAFLRIPVPVPVSAYFFAPLAYRNILQVPDPEKRYVVYLCYEPNEIDLQKCVEVLIARYPILARQTKQEIENLARLATETYSGDLVSCDLHFALMEKANLPFSAALAGNPEVNGFHVVDALASGDKQLIELRLAQCDSCGEEATHVFMALVYFLKQVASVQAELSVTNNISTAFAKVYIPYPAQARIQKALKVLNTEKILRFFLAAAKIETELKMQKSPHEWLSAELICLVN